MQPDSSSTAVERALNILEALAEHRDGLSHAQLSRRFRIPKSSASYLLRTLEQRGYVRREGPRGRYRLGLKVVNLGRGALGGLDIREAAAPVLRALVERCGLTAHLAVLDRGQAVYIEKAEAPGFIKMDTWVGRRMYVHCTSVGKALVASLPRAELEAILREHGLSRHTPATLTSPARLWKELEKVRAQGYAVDDEENSVGVRCVAAAVVDALSEVKAAVGVTGTTGQLPKANVPRVAELVRAAARDISRQLA